MCVIILMLYLLQSLATVKSAEWLEYLMDSLFSLEQQLITSVQGWSDFFLSVLFPCVARVTQKQNTTRFGTNTVPSQDTPTATHKVSLCATVQEWSSVHDDTVKMNSIIHTHLTVGWRWKTQREPTQTEGEHATLTPQRKASDPGIQPRTFFKGKAVLTTRTILPPLGL